MQTEEQEEIFQGHLTKEEQEEIFQGYLTKEEQEKFYKQGKEEGKYEEKEEIAKKLIKIGDSPEKISKVTNLSIEKIERPYREKYK